MKIQTDNKYLLFGVLWCIVIATLFVFPTLAIVVFFLVVTWKINIGKILKKLNVTLPIPLHSSAEKPSKIHPTYTVNTGAEEAEYLNEGYRITKQNTKFKTEKKVRNKIRNKSYTKSIWDDYESVLDQFKK